LLSLRPQSQASVCVSDHNSSHSVSSTAIALLL